MPTAIAFAPDGSFYISDGYGNARVHRFDASGRLMTSWGAPGSRDGEFTLPHHVLVRRDGTVLVCDREGDRIQIFGSDGDWLASIGGIRRPAGAVELADGRLIVAELAWTMGEVSARRGPRTRNEPARLSLLAPDGSVLSRFRFPLGAAGPVAPHGLAADSRGALYVTDVGFPPREPRHPRIHKLVPR